MRNTGMRAGMRVRALVLLFLFFLSSISLLVPSQAQQSSSVEYISIQNDYIVWKYNNQVVIYQKTATAFTKVYGPSTFQSVTSSYVQNNFDSDGCRPHDDMTAWQDYWNTNVIDPNNWYVHSKYIVIPVEWQFRNGNYSNVDYAFCYYYIDLENLQITKGVYVYHGNTTGYTVSIQNMIQQSDGPVALVILRDRGATPDDLTLGVFFSNPPDSLSYVPITTALSIATEVKYSDAHIILELTTNNCTLDPYYSYSTYIIANRNVRNVYNSSGSCGYHGTPDPVFGSISYNGKAGNSIYVSQNNTRYICDTNPNATTTIQFFSDCIEVSSFPPSYTVLVSGSTVRTNQQLLASGDISPHYLFTSNNISFVKPYYLMDLGNSNILSVSDSILLISKNITPYVVKLYSERGGNIYTDDPQFLVSPNVSWLIRKSVFDPQTNTTTDTDYQISNIQYTNGIEVNTLLRYLNPSDDSNIKIYLVWRMTMNNTTYERVWELQWLKQFQLSASGIDMTQNLTLAEHTVIFTDPNLANTTMFVKAMGSNILVNQTKTSPDRFKMIAVEGNCYTVNKMNQAFTFLANFCAVAPFITTIGASDGSEGNILIGVYWFPQWWVTHIYYEQNNTVDVIIHKTPPFTYKIVIKDSGGNTIVDTNYQTGNNDPLTRNFALSSDSKHLLTVYGRESNRELIVYTAEILKKPALPQFLPNINYSGINVIFIVAIVSMLMWTKNNASVGIVITVVALAILNYLGLLSISDSLFALLLFLAGAGIIISKRLFG